MNFWKAKKGKPTDLKKENKPKAFLWGSLPILGIILFLIFSLIYREYEGNYIKQHGVWTILTKTGEKIGYRSNYLLLYTFTLNYEIYNGCVGGMTEEERKFGNRFFVVVLPGDLERKRIYEAVPDWFDLEPPPQGWKTKPTESELKALMELAEQNRSSEAPNVVPYAEAKPSSNQNDPIQKWINRIKNPSFNIYIGVCIYFSLVFFFYRRRHARRIRKQGVWTILTIVSRKNGKYGMEVNYKYQLNDQMHTGSGVLSKSQSKTSANRFFLVVMPGETMKKQIENAVPDWFTGEAPPQGWDKLPTETELRKYMNKRRVFGETKRQIHKRIGIGQ